MRYPLSSAGVFQNRLQVGKLSSQTSEKIGEEVLSDIRTARYGSFYFVICFFFRFHLLNSYTRIFVYGKIKTRTLVFDSTLFLIKGYPMHEFPAGLPL